MSNNEIQNIVNNINNGIYNDPQLAQLLQNQAGIIRANAILFIFTQKTNLNTEIIEAIKESLNNEAISEFKFMGRFKYKHFALATLIFFKETNNNNEHIGLLDEDMEIINELIKNRSKM